MATVPLSGTNIRLLSGVPFSNDYKHTRWFDNVTSQTDYFLGKSFVHSISQANFQRIEDYHFIAVNKSIDELWNTNYLMFQNASYNSKWFYAFITKLEYKQKNLTWVHFQIDVFQTWKFDMTFKPSYVIREHCKLWETDGTPVINTVDEGLNYGSDYETKTIYQYIPYTSIFFLVIVCTERMDTNGTGISPTLNGSPQPLTYYVHPFKMNGTIPTVTISGLNIDLSDIKDVLKSLYTQTNAVKNVSALYVTEYLGFDIPYDGALNLVDMSVLEHVTIQNGTDSFNTLRLANLPEYQTKTETWTNKYAGYSTVTESKLLMHPYAMTILSDMKGNIQEIKNENIQGNDLLISVKGSMGVSNKVSYNVKNYLMDESTMANAPEVALEKGIINNSPNDVPIITDLLSAYLQGNRNSIENQKSSILFNGQANILGGFIGGVGASLNRNGVGVASSSLGVVQGAGNAVLQIEGLQAKQKDIDNTPSQLTKMGGNTAFDYGNDIKGLYIIKKQIRDEYIRKLEHFFNLYGYKLNEVKIPNFHTRTYWNYVQTSSCIITGNFNNDDLQELKSIFDNGITFWHTDDIGNYTLENGVI